MASNFTTNNIPVGIGYDSNGNAKGLIELSSISVSSTIPASSIPFQAQYISSISVSTIDDISLTSDYTDVRILYVSGNINVVLPPVADNTFRIITVHNTGASAVTLVANGSEEINGSATYSLSTQYDTVTVHSDGNRWAVI